MLGSRFSAINLFRIASTNGGSSVSSVDFEAVWRIFVSQ